MVEKTIKIWGEVKKLPAFNQQASCPKCSNADLRKRYFKETSSWYEVLDNLTIYISEYLIVTCSSCGYVWNEKCADYKEEE